MSNRKCICCDKQINCMEFEEELSDESQMWINGVTDKITCNYGSKFDESRLIISICDSCIELKLKEGVINIKQHE